MSKPFTKKQIKKYLDNPTKCPLCDGDVKVEDDFIEESMSREIYCDNNNCGVKFHEVFEMVSIEKAE